MTEHQDDTPKWVVKFYNGLWTVLKILLIVGFIAAIIVLRIRFDIWYFNWLTK